MPTPTSPALARAKRVVFYDTLLKQLNARRGGSCAGARAGPLQAPAYHASACWGCLHSAWLALPCWAGCRQRGWFYTGLGVTPSAAHGRWPARTNDALALLLFLLAVPVLTLLASPRCWRIFRAARNLRPMPTPGSQAHGSALASRPCSSCTRTTPPPSRPDPVYARYYYSHPPAVERLARMPAPVNPPLSAVSAA